MRGRRLVLSIQLICSCFLPVRPEGIKDVLSDIGHGTTYNGINSDVSKQTDASERKNKQSYLIEKFADLSLGSDSEELDSTRPSTDLVDTLGLEQYQKHPDGSQLLDSNESFTVEENLRKQTFENSEELKTGVDGLHLTDRGNLKYPHSMDKKGWEGLNFHGKRGWEGLNFHDKRGWEGMMPFARKRGWEGLSFTGKRNLKPSPFATENKRGWEGILAGKKRTSRADVSSFVKDVVDSDDSVNSERKNDRNFVSSKRGWEGLISGKRGWEGFKFGKRGWEGFNFGKRGWEGIGKRGFGETDKRGWEGFGFGKRGWEGFGLGRRGWEGIGKRGWEGFGLGKRGWEGFGVGKRGWEGIGKRGWEGFGLGKRGWEGFGLGKRGWEGTRKLGWGRFGKRKSEPSLPDKPSSSVNS